MKNTKGFTLIELLVIISIIFLMSITIFSNYGKNNEIFALERSSQKMTQDIRRGQEMSISGLVGSATTCGYGLFFDKTTEPSAVANQYKYIIYEEKDADCNVAVRYWQSGTDTVKETIYLETGVKICDILSDGVTIASRSISFEPPNPLTYLGGVSSGHTAAIVLCVENDTSITRTITVNNAGMVQLTK
jgi:type II secretory pathway pseudopilin PulG